MPSENNIIIILLLLLIKRIIIMLGVKRACSDDRYEAPHVRVQSPSIDEGMWQDIRKG